MVRKYGRSLPTVAFPMSVKRLVMSAPKPNMNTRKIVLKNKWYTALKFPFNVQFQKISIPTLWKVNGNSEGGGDLKSQNFKRKERGLTGISRGVG